MARRHHHRLGSATALQAAVASFALAPPRVTANHDVLVALKRAAVQAGMVLCGEIHGVAENPAVAYSLLDALDLHALALEWPPTIRPLVEAFLASGRLDPDAVLDAEAQGVFWSGDGRITAGHFALLQRLAQEERLKRLVLFDEPATWHPPPPGLGSEQADDADYATLWSWNAHDRAMARAILAGRAGGVPMLVMAGNLHAQLRPHDQGMPMGAHLAAAFPATCEIRIRYASGSFYNFGLRSLGPSLGRPAGHSQHLRLRRTSDIVFEAAVGAVHAAAVPHRRDAP